jgi:hypothetical protein
MPRTWGPNGDDDAKHEDKHGTAADKQRPRKRRDNTQQNPFSTPPNIDAISVFCRHKPPKSKQRANKAEELVRPPGGVLIVQPVTANQWNESQRVLTSNMPAFCWRARARGIWRAHRWGEGGGLHSQRVIVCQSVCL